jgi:hypothetical protein
MRALREAVIAAALALFLYLFFPRYASGEFPIALFFVSLAVAESAVHVASWVFEQLGMTAWQRRVAGLIGLACFALGIGLWAVRPNVDLEQARSQLALHRSLEDELLGKQAIELGTSMRLMIAKHRAAYGGYEEEARKGNFEESGKLYDQCEEEIRFDFEMNLRKDFDYLAPKIKEKSVLGFEETANLKGPFVSSTGIDYAALALIHAGRVLTEESGRSVGD